MVINMKKLPVIIAAFCAFISLIIFPDAAAYGVKSGLSICTEKIIPSLLPFFIASSLLTNLGATAYIGRLLSPVSSRLFKVSGCGGSAFIMGLTGGYPLGASYIAEMYTKGQITRSEAERLIVFCNNSGPAFIIGAVGVGVFNSSAVGVFLYAVHILAAMCGGIILSGKSESAASYSAAASDVGFAKAFTDAVKSSVGALINVCGFILAFSVLVSLFDAAGAFSLLTGKLAACTGLELSFCRALLTGVLELGSGIGAMAGLGITPLNLALAAFLLGWGGVSVHFQSFAVIAETDIKTARYIIGRFVIAIFGAIFAFFGAKLLF